MGAHDAQYDNPLRRALLHTEGRPAVGIRTADEEIIRGGGQAGRPEHGASVVPGMSHRIHGHFMFSRLSAYSPAGIGNLSPALPHLAADPRPAASAGVPEAPPG
jgi:hypothetical protein